MVYSSIPNINLALISLVCRAGFLRLMQMKIINLILVSVTLLLVSAAPAAQPLEIRFAYDVAQDTPKGQMALRFKELVEQRYAGSVVVKLFPDKQLYGDETVLQELLAGNVELAAPPLTQFKRYSSRLQLFDLPFLFVNQIAAQRFVRGIYGQRLMRTLEPKGLIGLGYLDNGMKQLSANKPLYLPEDAAGMTFRIMDSDVLEKQFRQIGANALRKPFSEVYALLQTQEVDGQENTWSNMYSQQFHQVQPYIVDSNHGYLGYMVATSADFWNSLSLARQKELVVLLEEAIRYGNQIAQRKAEQDRLAVIASGTSQVYALTEVQRSHWVKAMRPVWQQFEDQIGSELINAAASQR